MFSLSLLRIAIAGVLSICLCLPAWAQQSTPPPAAKTVHLDAGVTLEGNQVIGLAREDFVVFDQWKRQQLTGFAAGEQPLDILILFDVSGNMLAGVQAIAAGAHDALSKLHPGDRVGIMVHDGHSRVLLPFTADLDAVERMLRTDVVTQKFTGMIMSLTAADNAAKFLLSEPQSDRRRAVLHVTVDMSMLTRNSYRIVGKYWRADATYSNLIIHKYAGRLTRAMGFGIGGLIGGSTFQASVKGIAADTGGDVVSAADSGLAFQDVIARLRSRYTLWYEQPRDGYDLRRKIRVRLSDDAAKRFPKAKVRARTGYFAAKKS